MSFIKCDPRVFERCPGRKFCGDNPEYAKGSECDEFAESILNQPVTNAAPRLEFVITGSESTPLTPSNSSGLDTVDEIAAKTDLRSNVTQLMEEAAELIAACSKYLRTCGIGQPTPVTVDEALAMIGEEAADVHLVTEVIMQQSEAVDDVFTETANRKILRWKGRLENDRQR